MYFYDIIYLCIDTYTYTFLILKGWVIFSIVAGSLLIPFIASAQDIYTDAFVVAPRSAPGESMPVRVSLSNFGSSTRADAIITYAVVDSVGHEVLSDTETVAVDTTASLIHYVLFPRSIQPGSYTMRVSVVYQGQQVPAVSSFQFLIERKIFGIFMSDFLRYGFISLMTLLLILGLVWIFEKYHHRTKIIHDYSEVPSKNRIYYQITADIIQQMRIHEGDKALDMVAQLPTLMINPNSGEVTSIIGDPAATIASLVVEYEKMFGKRVSLALGKKMQDHAIIKSKS